MTDSGNGDRTVAECHQPARPVLLFGGSFDPIHRGHLHIAQALYALLQRPELRLILSASPPNSPAPSTSAAHRMAMVRLALAATDWIADDRELRRGGTSWTIDTLRELRAERGAEVSLCLCLGADVWPGFESWRDSAGIRGLANIILCPRPGAERPAEPAVLDGPKTLVGMPAGGLWWADIPMVRCSSTAVRQSLAEGRALAGQLPAAVMNYISEHRLYARAMAC